MDFLGLKTLTFINEALHIIKQTENKTINISKIPFDDKKTYELLCNGETFGVFQFESSGMRDLLRKAKPNVFEDVAALLAEWWMILLTGKITVQKLNTTIHCLNLF